MSRRRGHTGEGLAPAGDIRGGGTTVLLGEPPVLDAHLDAGMRLAVEGHVAGGPDARSYPEVLVLGQAAAAEDARKRRRPGPDHRDVEAGRRWR